MVLLPSARSCPGHSSCCSLTGSRSAGSTGSTSFAPATRTPALGTVSLRAASFGAVAAHSNHRRARRTRRRLQLTPPRPPRLEPSHPTRPSSPFRAEAGGQGEFFLNAISTERYHFHQTFGTQNNLINPPLVCLNRSSLSSEVSSYSSTYIHKQACIVTGSSTSDPPPLNADASQGSLLNTLLDSWVA